MNEFPSEPNNWSADHFQTSSPTKKGKAGFIQSALHKTLKELQH